MKREHGIPLFLWIAFALCVHALWGGGAEQVSQWAEERKSVANFIQAARGMAKAAAKPMEIELESEVLPEPIPAEPPEASSDEPSDESDPTAPKEQSKPKPEPVPEKPKPKEIAKKPDVPLPEKRPQLFPTPIQPPPPPPPPPAPDRRVAVKQNVEDPNQEDNPNARHIADEANKVAEETQAKITSTDSNDQKPAPGASSAPKSEDPGNSEKSKLAQSEATKGTARVEQQGSAQTEQRSGQAPATPSKTPSESGSRGQTGQKAQEAQAAAPTVQEGGEAGAAWARGQAGQDAKKGRKELPGQKPRGPLDALGLGSDARTENGIRLNLSLADAHAAIGEDKLTALRRQQIEKRRTEHQGSFKGLGLEHFRAAIENYVSAVKPGNQTALNAARKPFASYLNEIHNRIHPIFAEGFLMELEALPPNHPLNQEGMSTHVEIAVSPVDGHIVKLGVVKPSGVTMFDVGALSAVEKASPFGPAPAAIVSSDGNVYLHWEFHRTIAEACSTFFAHPYLLNLGPPAAAPAPAAPQPAPERSPNPHG